MMDDDTALLPPNASKSGKHWLVIAWKCCLRRFA